MKSPFATDLLGALGRLDALGGGRTSKLDRGGGDSNCCGRLSGRESVLCASTKSDGADVVETRCTIGAEANVGVGTFVGVRGSEGDGFPLFVDAARESPRAGLSACLGGGGPALEVPPSIRLGSSNGFTSESREASETGDPRTALSVGSSRLTPASTGDAILGDLGSREPTFFPCGTSCNLNASLLCRLYEPVSKCCGFGRSSLPSWPTTTAGEAPPDAGVLPPDVSLFLLLPFSWKRICGLGFAAGAPPSASRSADTERIVR